MRQLLGQCEIIESRRIAERDQDGAAMSDPCITGTLERVMNSIRNGLGMRETEIAKEPSRLWNPHFYAVFVRVHNTL
jgi:hypothetical protein